MFSLEFSNHRWQLYHTRIAYQHGTSPGHVAHSDILLHLPILEFYASKCQSCVEFGVRDGHSTVALLAGLGQSNQTDRVLTSVDVERTPAVDVLSRYCLPVPWVFCHMSTVDFERANEIPEADLFLVDTLHTGEHIRKELVLHGHKAKRYLIFHDTFTCGIKDSSGSNPEAEGILPAIWEYCQDNWQLVYGTELCNGLMVYERVVPST
jgi:hypothetical protein